jgi:two-component system, NarL family, response regulator YdfI
VRVPIRNLFELTPREGQILEAVLRGQSTKEIAETYSLGQQTVKNYLTTIYEKQGVQNRLELVGAKGRCVPLSQ